MGFAADGVDLAVLAIPNVDNLPTIPVANSTTIRPGQTALIIGNPLGERFTLNTGRVSGAEGQYVLLDINANPGNSGGPVLNDRGELIAVMTLIRPDPRGVGAGVPRGIASNMVRAVLKIASEKGVEDGLSRISTLPAPYQIAVNDLPMVGTLNRGSLVASGDGSFYDQYLFKGRAGQEVVINMSSNQVNPYLLLSAPDGQRIKEEKGEGETAQIRLRLPSDGLYSVIANTDRGGETGAYRLQLTERGFQRPQNQGVILQERGILAFNSPKLEDDKSRYQQHTFRAEAGDRIAISMDSNDFDTYLGLFAPEGNKIEQNDNRSSTSTNSEIQVTLSRAGTYTVYANAKNWIGQGAYTLSIVKLN